MGIKSEEMQALMEILRRGSKSKKPVEATSAEEESEALNPDLDLNQDGSVDEKDLSIVEEKAEEIKQVIKKRIKLKK